MAKRPLLVAGVDPGTTVGLALLDLKGKIVLLHSGKHISIDKLVEKAADVGKVVLVGCDKKKVPELVDKFARKFGVQATTPVHDLLTLEKKDLVGALKYGNSHEFDALAAAIYALKEYSPLLRKIRVFVRNYKKDKIADQVTELVIKKGISIRLAADALEHADKEEVRLVRKVVEEESVPKRRILVLYERLQKERERAGLMKEENKRLERELNRLCSLTNYLRKKIDHLGSDEKTEEILRLRLEQAQGLRNQLAAMASEMEELKTEISEQRVLMAGFGDRVLVKKLRNLGSEEFTRKAAFLQIAKGDVLMVDDPNIVSASVLQKLRQLGVILIVRKKISAKLAEQVGVPVVSQNGFSMVHTRYFASVSKTELEKARSRSAILKEVVRDYQASRK